MKSAKQIFFVEVTDTFGGEANYCWVHRYLVKATSLRGAVSVVSKHEGFAGSLKLDGNYGDMTRHNVSGAAICIFTQYADEGNSDGVEALNFESNTRMKNIYTVVVSNVGTVCEVNNKRVAIAAFNEYKMIVSEKPYRGRMGGEDVTLFANGEILKEWINDDVDMCGKCYENDED